MNKGAIDTLRGIALLLILGFHLLNDSALSGERDFYRWLSYSFQNIRLPLFTLISGYLYGLRPVLPGSYGLFLRGKVSRLLIPALLVALLQFSASALLPIVNKPENPAEIWKVVIYGYEHFWFIHSIMLIFLFVCLVDAVGSWLSSIRGWLIILALAAVTFVSPVYVPKPYDLFAIGGAIYLLPFFLFGYGVSSFGLSESRSLVGGAAVVVAVLIIAQQLAYFSGYAGIFGKRSLAGLGLGLAVGLLVLTSRLHIRLLSAIGALAFSIYLWQGFTLAIGRRVALMLGLEGHLYFMVALALGAFTGYALHHALNSVSILRRPLLGLK